MRWTSNSCLDYPKTWPKMSCATPHLSHIKSIPKKPLLVYDRKYSSETSSEEIETLEPSLLNNNDHNGITLTCKDKAHPSTTCPMPHNGWITPRSLWTSIEIGHQIKETIVEITKATTSKDDKIPIAIKEITPKTTSKGMPLLPWIHQMPASNVEKWDTMLGTAQSAAQTTSIIEQPTWSTSMIIKTTATLTSLKKIQLKPSKPNWTPCQQRTGRNLPSQWEEEMNRIFPQPN